MGDHININRRTILAGAALAGALAPVLATSSAWATGTLKKASAAEIAALPREKVELVKPPFVHAHSQVANGGPKVVEFTMVIEEKKMILDDAGTEVHAMTFNGTVPGPLMVVHQDDYVELTLINPETNTLMHNIDFHAATGALGGGGLTEINPGEKTVLRFKATKPGVFVYHCAPPGMVPWHVTSGMNGAIMVLPREGLNDGKGNPLTYDKVYYVGEQDFYVPRDEEGNYKKYDAPGDSYEDVVKVMRTLTPTHVVFNGGVGALTGDKAMTAKVGEKVLIVHSQANRDTRAHLIGGHGDYVWATGKFNTPPDVDQETWFIPGGAAAAAFYTFQQPGIYAYVNHNLIEAFELGAAAHFKVTGEWNDDLMTSILAPSGM
ncbi:copper-containing nitrite reductase [Brucella pseudogrignonensis]|uniref:copper-containing nitrite reductase n=1 Tax=Brucella pseudogrignonensis TaxID=419475 RepID=UPI0028B8EC80|nr:copper-containing nitrite reductase [Brucella pseudogrignonensis]MDT6942051.1 copper-containing nitrite reductase [Brucella pseudogrignonensis]